MKTIVGIDPGEAHVGVLNLLSRLGFSGNSLHLLHVVEIFEAAAVGGPMPALDTPFELLDGMRKAGQTRLDQAEALCDSLGLVTGGQELREGRAHAELLELADASHADLIAMGPRAKGFMERVLFGSVTRALTSAAHQSLLLARGEIATTGKINAVFATDHSAYGDRCLKKLMEFAPSGLGKVTVLHASQQNRIAETLSRYGFAAPAGTFTAADEVIADNERIVEHLHKLGAEVHSVVTDQEVNEAIDETMRETQSELLILGAQGHGALERLLIGSVSAHQAAQSDRSLLLIRA